jgi:hypothetical protein
MDGQSKNPNHDAAWGAKEIGDEIDQNERQTFYLLEKGVLPAHKVGRKWVASRRLLREWVATGTKP